MDKPERRLRRWTQCGHHFVRHFDVLTIRAWRTKSAAAFDLSDSLYWGQLGTARDLPEAMKWARTFAVARLKDLHRSAAKWRQRYAELLSGSRRSS